MARTPFKMRGFSGFGNSPLRQDKKKMKKGVHNDTTYGYIEGMEKMSTEDVVKSMKRNLALDALKPGNYSTRTDSVLTGVNILHGRHSEEK